MNTSYLKTNLPILSCVNVVSILTLFSVLARKGVPALLAMEGYFFCINVASSFRACDSSLKKDFFLLQIYAVYIMN